MPRTTCESVFLSRGCTRNIWSSLILVDLSTHLRRLCRFYLLWRTSYFLLIRSSISRGRIFEQLPIIILSPNEIQHARPAFLLFYGKRAKTSSDTRMSYFETIYVPPHMTFSDAQASVKQKPSPFIHHQLSLIVPTITYHYKSVNTHNTHTTRTLILISYHQYVRIRTSLLFFGHLLSDWFLPLLFIVDDGRLSLRSAASPFQ
jgi:hypothetical protein